MDGYLFLELTFHEAEFLFKRGLFSIDISHFVGELSYLPSCYYEPVNINGLSCGRYLYHNERYASLAHLRVEDCRVVLTTTNSFALRGWLTTRIVLTKHPVETKPQSSYHSSDSRTKTQKEQSDEAQAIAAVVSTACQMTLF